MTGARHLALIAFVAGTLAPSLGQAQDVDSLLEVLEENVVSGASRSDQRAGQAPATSTTITAEELRRFGIVNLGDALNFLSLGMFSHDRMSTPEVGARGVAISRDSNSHVLVVLDGMVVNESVIVEIVKPGTGDPVAEGEVGEVVVTSFNPDYPMIRLATGDLSALMSGASPCGRTNLRIKGWMGRADQTAKIKGMFVHPKQVAELATRHPELQRLRLVVGRAAEQDTMTLMAECAAPASELAGSVAATLQSVTKLKGEVKLVAPGSLPNDGKVIADERPIG